MKKILQIDSIDVPLKNRLWNLVQVTLWDRYYTHDMENFTAGSNLAEFFILLWNNHYKLTIDSIPEYISKAVAIVKEKFFGGEWFEIYNFIEFLTQHHPMMDTKEFQKACNGILEEEKSGFRFLNGEIVPITSEHELLAIEKAIEQAQKFPGLEEHLNAAIKLFSDRKSPDFRNSIKESISAVESLCVTLSGNTKASLNEGLEVLEEKYGLHGALKAAFSSLYGYTSDANGIRHKLLDSSDLSIADAKFMLVACSAFTSYVIEKLSESVSK